MRRRNMVEQLTIQHLSSGKKITYTEEDVPQDLAETVMTYQDACNLIGVVHAFDRVMTALWAHAHKHGKGTDWVNNHPLVFLTVEKLMQLCRYSQNDYRGGIQIYDFVSQIAKKGK
jgi:hypothetical protein